MHLQMTPEHDAGVLAAKPEIRISLYVYDVKLHVMNLITKTAQQGGLKSQVRSSVFLLPQHTQ